MPRPLSEVLTESAIRKLAGSTYFERGEEYFESEAVFALETRKDVVSARVKGTQVYEVSLRVENDGLAHECSCPLGDEGAFCKHAVAVGLAWLGRGPTSRACLDDVRSYLEKRDKKELVELLTGLAARDESLFDRFSLNAAGATPDLKNFRNALRRAIEIHDFVDWRSAGDYARKAEDAVETLRPLIQDGHAREVVDLSEHAAELLEASVDSMDDSDGHISGLLGLVADIHHEACRRARIEPAELAKRIFKLQMDSEYGFQDVVARYSDLLGSEGRAQYEKLARVEWEKLPALGPKDEDRQGFGRRWRLSSILEALAKDVDALVEIRKKDLSSPHQFLGIVQILEKARRYDEALEWAERGIQAFQGPEGEELREALARAYQRRGRHDEAMQLAWRSFGDRPWLAHYQRLKEHADKAKAWPEWRERALQLLRAQADMGRKRAIERGGYASDVDASTLVQVFLWEEDPEKAWAEAKVGGCREDLWHSLAKVREKTHPADALEVYQRQLDAALGHANNDAYRRSVELLKAIRGVMARLKREPDFGVLVSQVRQRHLRRKNFVAMLDKAIKVGR